MATNPVTSTPTGFQLALDALLAVTSLRRPELGDESSEFIEQASAPLFDAMLVAPCGSPAEIVRKGEAILAEYGGGDIAPELVAALIEDVRRWVQ